VSHVEAISQYYVCKAMNIAYTYSNQINVQQESNFVVYLLLTYSLHGAESFWRS